MDRFCGGEVVGESIADEVDKSCDVSASVDWECIFIEKSPSGINDKKYDENPIDVSEVGPDGVFLFHMSKSRECRKIEPHVHIRVSRDVYDSKPTKSFKDQSPMGLSV